MAVLSSALISQFTVPRRLCSNIFSFTFKLSLGLSLIRAVSSSVPRMSTFSYINAALAKEIDVKLMDQPGFTIDQLMELAGYSVAAATHDYINTLSASDNQRGVLIFCGPGNNGGDGLVAARHLKHFGYHPTIIYPKQGKATIFGNLVKQCQDLSIPIVHTFDENDVSKLGSFRVILDSLFGFSFDGAPREPYASMIQYFRRAAIPVVSVDIPSGWDVDKGDVHSTGFNPECVVSLTLPKQCMKNYQGVHYIGGR